MSIARKLIIAGEALPPGENFEAAMLLIGGGGAGGKGSNGNVAGGGGAGRLLRGEGVTLTTQEVYQIVCGDGGLRGEATKGKGYPTTFTGSLSGYVASAAGGGTGQPAPAYDISLVHGGSGGGGDLYATYGAETPSGTGFDSGFTATGVITFGNRGGAGEPSPYNYSNAGGGGGATGFGGEWASTGGGRGGTGVGDSITGHNVIYAGGGGGGSYTGGPAAGGCNNAGQGGYGGGYATDATKGCGGGGASGANQFTTAGKGGTGIVIIRSQKTALATTGTFTLYTDGIYNIYEFTTNGSISFT